MELQDQRIVVTGGLGALGIAVINALQAAGAKTAVLDRAAPSQIPTAATTSLSVDLGDAAATRRGFAELAQRLGHVDGLVNLAGGFRWELIADGSSDTWDLLYHMNLKTAVHASQAALPYFPPSGGRIVNVGAVAALKASAGMGAYAASKAGVAKLTEALAEELMPRGITVNAVLPSIIDTPANRAAMPDLDSSRWVSPQSLADVILFLLSRRAASITGALIPVSGGL